VKGTEKTAANAVGNRGLRRELSRSPENRLLQGVHHSVDQEVNDNGMDRRPIFGSSHTLGPQEERDRLSLREQALAILARDSDNQVSLSFEVIALTR
jgi:hypothetical protein